MKKFAIGVLLISVVLSCAEKETGLLMETASTIPITEIDTNDSIIRKAAHVVPTTNQYEALKNEFIAFIHFGPNTFTRMEWGNGMENPEVFNLQNLDTDQWCKAMKEAEMKMVIITVKHHDGFVLWQSRYTEHGIMSTPFKDGKGDILRELSESCKKYGLKLGVYLSPADLYQIENKEGLYGNLSEYTERTIPRPVAGKPFENKTTFKFKVDDYNEYFLNQLFELLTEYGPIHEVWFDGAHPKRKGGQTYNYLAWKELIHQLAPKAVVFGKQDIRWCGNEAGQTRDTEWNIIPYTEDPAKLNRFADLTNASLGQREDLYKGKFLHYQQAETNTSIRAGWFYRDDTNQKVRSSDDVFDMYERSVGGNSTFLLNIPPNREGKFSPQDVEVLQETGKRIRATYATNLLAGASGPESVLDADTESYELLSDENKEIIITTSSPITINRLVLQEAIATHSERVEIHTVEAWVNDSWQEIAKATNIGYKRILRFPEVTTKKLRIKVLESRLAPAISNITAHYYKTRPPQLSITRTVAGAVSIQPKKEDFVWHYWKPDADDISKNLNGGYEIRYTTDGSLPTKASALFTSPFSVNSGEIKALALDDNEKGSVASAVFGILKKDWKIIGADSSTDKRLGEHVFDEDENTYWSSNESNASHYLEIDLGTSHTLSGFGYTPQKIDGKGMIERGLLKISDNGKTWRTVADFEFGNLINDPTQRTHNFKSPITTRYIRIESKVIAGGGKSAAIAELDFFN
ncbi:alpha-L-fucosidase [Cellulophaga sp. F20128]|uniref:alpha-L-fucosidase n=1 Tax=Cellulophaga sp. F20128 TaxID=2926413 RepID=UPI001FF5A24B|nr:alpha-L-fucosidase [Cellulophaga sp. F20128]MCK0156291.1 alpha-L-fucosidase [Cellulophaga sp. F20128]